jgi:hypothetical protein
VVNKTEKVITADPCTSDDWNLNGALDGGTFPILGVASAPVSTAVNVSDTANIGSLPVTGSISGSASVSTATGLNTTSGNAVTDVSAGNITVSMASIANGLSGTAGTAGAEICGDITAEVVPKEPDETP